MNCEIIKDFNGNLELFIYISFYNELYDYFNNWIKVTSSIVLILFWFISSCSHEKLFKSTLA